MKIRITMKDPDGFWDGISSAVMRSMESLDLNDDEKRRLSESRTSDMQEFACKWFSDSEYLTVEIDSDTGTCVVVEQA